MKGDGILFGGLWIRDVLAENGVAALVGDWEKEAPKLAFFGDILSGDAGPWARFGSAVEWASSRKVGHDSVYREERIGMEKLLVVEQDLT